MKVANGRERVTTRPTVRQFYVLINDEAQGDPGVTTKDDVAPSHRLPTGRNSAQTSKLAHPATIWHQGRKHCCFRAAETL